MIAAGLARPVPPPAMPEPVPNPPASPLPLPEVAKRLILEPELPWKPC